jgi:hypothetical protein
VPAAPSPEGFWPVTAVDPPRAASETAPHDRKRSAKRATAAVATLVLCTAAFGTWTLSQREAAPPLAVAAAIAAPTAVPSAPTMARAAVGAGSVVSAPEPVPATASPAAAARARDTTVATLLTAKPKASAPARAAQPKAMSTTLDTRPLDECAEKNFLLRSLCLRQACEQPQLHMHSRCVGLRAEDEARAQSQLNR